MNLKIEEYTKKISSFVNWAAEFCDPKCDEIFHSWISGSSKTGVAKGGIWKCCGLWDAFEQYQWPAQDPLNRKRISMFEETSLCLASMGAQLSARIDQPASGSVLEAVDNVLSWGGVQRYQKVASIVRNSEWSNEKRAEYLSLATRQLKNEMRSISGRASIILGNEESPLQIDSGTTKVFSLLVPGFIIYDSRVAAAIGLLAVRWIQATGGCEIPESLRFSWQNGSSKIYSIRNPNRLLSSEKNVFPRAHSGDAESKIQKRLADNIKASWLCDELLRVSVEKFPSSGFATLDKNTRARALESALFMIGYSIFQEI